MKKNFFTGFLCALFLVLFLSAAPAEETLPDPAENLAAYGLDPKEFLVERLGFDPGEDALRFPKKDRPFYLWYDITGDGCMDLFLERMVGSGMVRVDVRVYDPLTGDSWNLDGYNYYYLLSGVFDGKVRLIKEGPYGYGDPIRDTYGTVILDNGRLVFIADMKPDAEGDDLFDPEQVPVAPEQAVRVALAYVQQFPRAGFCNDAAPSRAVLEKDGTEKNCWCIALCWLGDPRYSVWVNAETGEVEDCAVS